MRVEKRTIKMTTATTKRQPAPAAQLKPTPTTAHAVAVVPAQRPTVPATVPPDNRTPAQRYVDALAPSTIAGRLLKFGKDGQFTILDDGAPVDPTADFIALCDETLIGWVKFPDDGGPPERRQGLLYHGFAMPDREDLGDLDQHAWPIGLSGAPTDPWLHQVNLVLQHRATAELFTFATTSPTGRRAVGDLLKHFERLVRSGSKEVPLVKLRPGGFNHRDARIGWVATPNFVIVGSAPRDSAAEPEPTTGDVLDDELPF
jgi:hypothetical protein